MARTEGGAMELEEFMSAVGKIVGVKDGVEYAHIYKVITTGDYIVRLQIRANPNQAKKLKQLIN